MSSKNAAMEAALLEIAKDLLQASDDLAPTNPSASAKLAHEAYEIGRDLGIVRDHVDDDDEFSNALAQADTSTQDVMPEPQPYAAQPQRYETEPAQQSTYRRRDVDDDSDDELLRILDRQRAILPKPVDISPVRKPSRGAHAMTFDAPQPRRSGWFGWMRSREWRHAG